MASQRTLLTLTMVLALAVGACGGLKQPAPKLDYYTLEYDPPLPKDIQPIAAVLGIEPFSAPYPYNTREIVYSEDPFTRQAYRYHKWHASPAELITHFLLRDLRASRLFTAVFSAPLVAAPTHKIEGRVEAFFERDHGKTCEGVLSVTIALVALEAPDPAARILFQKTYRSAKSCAQKSPAALAEALSRATAQVSATITKDVADRLNKIAPMPAPEGN